MILLTLCCCVLYDGLQSLCLMHRPVILNKGLNLWCKFVPWHDHLHFLEICSVIVMICVHLFVKSEKIHTNNFIDVDANLCLGFCITTHCSGLVWWLSLTEPRNNLFTLNISRITSRKLFNHGIVCSRIPTSWFRLCHGCYILHYAYIYYLIKHKWSLLISRVITGLCRYNLMKPSKTWQTCLRRRCTWPLISCGTFPCITPKYFYELHKYLDGLLPKKCNSIADTRVGYISVVLTTWLEIIWLSTDLWLSARLVYPVFNVPSHSDALMCFIIYKWMCIF